MKSDKNSFHTLSANFFILDFLLVAKVIVMCWKYETSQQEENELNILQMLFLGNDKCVRALEALGDCLSMSLGLCVQAVLLLYWYSILWQ